MISLYRAKDTLYINFNINDVGSKKTSESVMKYTMFDFYELN